MAASKAIIFCLPGEAGERLLGIPTVRDRVVQQALRSIIEPLFEPGHRTVRYADDILILCGSRSGAKHALRVAESYLEEELRLMDLTKVKAGITVPEFGVF